MEALTYIEVEDLVTAVECIDKLLSMGGVHGADMLRVAISRTNLLRVADALRGTEKEIETLRDIPG